MLLYRPVLLAAAAAAIFIRTCADEEGKKTEVPAAVVVDAGRTEPAAAERDAGPLAVDAGTADATAVATDAGAVTDAGSTAALADAGVASPTKKKGKAKAK